MSSAANADGDRTPGTAKSPQGDHGSSAGQAESLPSNDHPHPWYDDDFCPGGGAFVGKEKPLVACPTCGEMMDVDEEGCLFKHRPRIPGTAHGSPDAT